MRARNKALGITLNLPKNYKGHELVIITCGWNSDRKRATYTSVQALCAQNNLASITFDFRGTGDSPGKLNETNLVTMIEDIESIIEHAKSKIRNLTNITIVSNSLSAEAALIVAFSNPIVKKLILCSAGFGKTLSKRDNSERKFFWDGIKNFTGLSFKEYKTLLEKINIPVFLIHGVKDERVPVSLARELEKLLNNATVTLNLVEGANHKFESKEDIRLQLIAKALFP